MKVLPIIILLFVLAIISSFNYHISSTRRIQDTGKINSAQNSVDNNGSKPDLPKVQYYAEASLNNSEKKVYVSTSIKINSEDSGLSDTLFFFMGLNDILTNSVFSKSIDQKFITLRNFDIDKIEVNGVETELNFYDTGLDLMPDSAICYLDLKNINISESLLNITFDYRINISSDSPIHGYASGREFYYVSNWLPRFIIPGKTTLFKEKILNKIIDEVELSDYEIDLSLPEGFKLISNAGEVDSSISNERINYKLTSHNSYGFTWIAADEIVHTGYSIDLSSGKTVKLDLFLQPENKRYLERYRDAAVNTIKYFEGNFQSDAFQSISLVDIPHTSVSAFLTSDNLITIKSALISTKGLADIEFYTARLIGRQFFKKALNLQCSVNNWIIEGLSTLYATEIVKKYFEPPKLSFKFAYQYPVYGMNYLSFNDIPVVYSLIELEYDLGLKNLSGYYNNVTMGKVNDSFYNYPNFVSYRNNKLIKPYLLLKSLIDENGIDKFNRLLRTNVLNAGVSNKTDTQNNFIKLLNKLSKTSIDQFINSSVYVDYAVRSVEMVGDGKYKILVQRIGDAVCTTKVILYTDDRAIENNWYGAERFKTFVVSANKPAYAAEIILTDTKFLDINFANNSYTLDNQYWGSLSLAIRVFFWFQNAIMIFGSAS